ncbi:MAG: hypothetical protein K2X28_05150 [Alphaproteobacteria bacterium]|nr:hypothetical protein [Alphaproteobacteria bacterium]
MATGIGPILVKVPRARDRKGSATEEETIRFVSHLLPPYVLRSKSIEMALPYLYLKGLSSGDFSQVMPVCSARMLLGFQQIRRARFRSGMITHVGILHELGHEEPRYIAMDSLPNEYKTRDYGLRWGIENMFSDFKSRGFSS